MTNHFSTTLRRQRARIFGVTMLLFVVAGLALSPIATASADTATADGATQPSDTRAPGTTSPTTTTDAPTAPTTTTGAPAPTSTTVPSAAPTTAVAPVAAPGADDDGVAADVESRAPHDGDNNRDGIADAQQANVASLPAAIDVDGNGKLDDYVTIVSPAGTELRNVRAVRVPADNPPPDGVTLPYGLFDYEVKVANPGDSAAVTYITPDGYVPDGVHFLQNGTWSDLGDRTDVDAHTGDVTVQLQDGGAGDANVAPDAVIADPSGPSTRDRSITVNVVSGAGAPNFTFKLESCTNSGIGGGCTSATAVPTTQGSNDAAGQSAALGNGGSWNWGGTPSTQLAQNTRYRLSVVGSLPSSGWDLSGITCTGVSSDSQDANAANAENVFLQNVSTARSTCTATFAQSVASITVHKKGDRNGASVDNLENASFQAYSNASYTTAVPGASCTTDGTGSCVIGALTPNTTYYVRETTAPTDFQRIDTLTTSSGGSQVYGQSITTGSSGSNTSTRDFANRRTNPAFPNECGINIGLVMDLSNSISDTELGQMKTSADAFVTALQGTPSKVGGYTFATNAPASGNSNLALTDVSSSGGADDARSWIDSRTKPGGSNGGTNWDAGFRQVVADAANYDVVVFLTDGNPTFYGDPQSGGTGSDTTFREVEEGVFSANELKAARAGLKVVGVAIGSDASTDNIQAISGPTANDDYYLAANFQDLQNKLQQIASELCGGTVTVKKQVEGPGGFSPAGGWTFAVPGSQQGTGVTAAGTGVTPAFDVTPGTVTVTETQQTGYSIVQQSGKNATCTKNGTAVPGTDVTNTTNGVSLGVGALDIVACEFRNTPAKATVNVAKQTNGGVGGPFTVQRSGNSAGTQNLNFTTSAGSNPTPFQGMSLFPGTYTLTETALPNGWNFSDVDCGTVNAGSKSTTLTVAAGQTVNCTFTNTASTGTIELKKVWSGALAGDAPSVSLQIGSSNGGSQVANVPVSGPGDGTTTAKTVNGGTYFVQESGLAAGWLQTGLSCSTNGGSSSPYVPANGVAVPSGGAVVCTVTNTRQKGTIELKKVWSGGAVGETPGTTLQIGTGSSGGAASNVASQAVTGPANGTTGAKNVGIGTYFVSETGLAAGWTQSALTCSVDGGSSSPYNAASGIAVANGQAVVCTVTNTRQTGTVTVDKHWSGGVAGETPQVDLKITGPSSSTTTVTGLADGTTGAKSVATGSYTVSEANLTAGWTAGAISCQRNGTGPMFGPSDFSVAAADNVVCSVTNARKVASITVNKHWSGAAAGETPQVTLTIAGPSGSSTGVTGPADGTTGAKTVVTGTYSVSETGLTSGWTQSDVSCQRNGTGPTFGPSDFSVAADDNVVCTFTNARQTGSVRVNKVWVGGAAGEKPTTDLHITGLSSSTTTVTGLADGTTGAKTVASGTYSASESGLSAGWTRTGASCVRNGTGDAFAPTSFAVNAGDSVVCTITNTRDTGTLRVDKTWVGGAVGDTPHATLQIDGPSSSSTPVTGLADGTTGTKTVATGTYTVGETALSDGWSRQSITCQNGTQPAFVPTGAGFPVAAGDAVVCTITNAKHGTITIVKDATPNADKDFGFTTSGLGGHFTLNDHGTAANTKEFGDLAAGTYSVTEDANPAGWSLTDVSCTGTGGSGDLATRTATVQLPAGGDVTCTFTNTGPDVGIVKTDSPDPVAAGGNLTYSLAVHNYGPPDAAPVEVTDPLPSNTTFVSLSADASWDCTAPAVGAAGTVSCTRTTLAAGADAPTITVVVKVGTSVAPGTDVISNTATVTTPDDSNPDNDTSTAETSVVRAVDLKIVKSDGGATPAAGGDAFQYTLSVDNLGPSDAATAATVTDVVPAGVSFESFGDLPGGVTCTPPGEGSQTFACTIPAAMLEVTDGAVVIPVNVTVPSATAPGDYTNEVIVSSSDDVAPCTVTATNITCDPADTDNYSEVTTPVTRVLDLSVEKSDGGAEPVAGGGDPFTYTITVDNLGPSDAGVAATVTDTLPGGVSFLSFGTLPAGVDCAPPVAGVFTCTVDPSVLHVDDPAVVITLRVTVPAATPAGTLTNTVTVSTPEEPCPGSPNCDNNTDHTDTPVTTSVNLTISKSDGGAQPVGGVSGSDAFTYTLTVDNEGPSDASADATVTDVMPPGIDFVSYGTLPEGASCAPPDGRTIECTIAKSLLTAASPDVVITVNVSVPATTPGGDVTNKVIVSNPDDEAPCTVTATDITCDPSDTDDYAQVTTPIAQVAPDVIPPAVPPVQVEAAHLAFTGSDLGGLAVIGVGLVALGGVLLVAVRRRRRSTAT